MSEQKENTGKTQASAPGKPDANTTNTTDPKAGQDQNAIKSGGMNAGTSGGQVGKQGNSDASTSGKPGTPDHEQGREHSPNLVAKE